MCNTVQLFSYYQVYIVINYTRNVLLAEDKKKYNAQNKGIFAKFCTYTNHTWFWGGLGL